MSNSVEIAVVGAGGIADVHAADIARMHGRARITAAADPDHRRLAAFADRWAVPAQYAELDELLAKERPDVVALCTPPALHADQARTCLAYPVTVWCEKPPALSLAELDGIAAAESAGPGQFAAVVQHRFGAGARRLRRLVANADARLGPPTSAVCHTLWFRPDSYFAVPWRGTWASEGGGPTMGHGIHQMDLLLSVLGPWSEVTAVAHRQARRTDTEDFSAAIVTFDNGAVATLINSVLAPRETSYLRFDFTLATIELEHLYGYDDDDWRVTAAPGLESAVAEAWAEGPIGVPSGHRSQLGAILDALDTGVAPPVPAAGIRPTMELITAIYASAFTGQAIKQGKIDADSPFYHRMDGAGAPWLSAALVRRGDQ